jgi:hypothetical protein
MLLQLQKYDIRPQYTPGKEIYIAVTLSRAYLKDLPNGNESNIEGVNMLSDLPISEQRISEIQQHTLSDEHMQKRKEVIQNGWPNSKYNVPPSAMIYVDVRDELTVQHCLIFKGERVVIPTSLRLDMIKRIHSSHIGVECCLRRARESLHWPGMNSQVKDFM